MRDFIYLYFYVSVRTYTGKYDFTQIATTKPLFRYIVTKTKQKEEGKQTKNSII